MRDALSFLTVLPIRRVAGPPAPTCVRWFPAAGLVIGLAWASCYAVVNRFLGPLVAAASVLCIDAALTGALHLDATADVADGVASRRPPHEAVRIMREPHVGAVGAAALVLVCLLRFSLLATMGSHALALIAAPVAGRAAMALLLGLGEARADGSLVGAFGPKNHRLAAETTLFAVVLTLLLAVWTTSLGPVGGLAIALASTALYARWWKARFGALTGDGVGASGVLAETLALLALTVGGGMTAGALSTIQLVA
jgi:adenosylcobinamide-GDP ribazoletransferase